MNTIEKCFSAAILSIEWDVLTVLHRKYNVTKLPGGTQNGDRQFWEERGEGGAFYNPFSQESVMKKLTTTLNNAFTKDVVKEHSERFQWLMNNILSQNLSTPEIHMVVEMIEESGVIPTRFNLSLKQQTAKDFHQYFYVVTESYTYSKDRNAVIEIKDLHRDLPRMNHDFFCHDMDIESIQVLNLMDVSRGFSLNNQEKILINTAHKHKNAINGYIMNLEILARN